MEVEIWSDVVCPWCAIGKRRFEEALSRFPHREDVEVVWRAFELDPAAGSEPAGQPAGATGYAERLAAKYGTDVASAQRMVDSMTEAAAAEGLEFRFDRAVRANTFQAHQVIHLAGERGVQDAVKARLLRAYFAEGEAVGDRETLVRLAGEAGLDAEEVRAVLADQRHADAVRADEAEAQALGIRGVPFFVLDRRYGVSGAQPADVLLQALERAWAERPPAGPGRLIGAGGPRPRARPPGSRPSAPGAAWS
ncbi:DsbA family oxidoreductase [Geodermatophilus marinus]|uniref:DsbA family oxidoreductase n=1 Tax=Geodermatophilus sp. LHW52908 TaxID=2303986 RepID=UPI000E3E6AF2|nr:DsbA family oxidoreductase [Geodermatophilus sp. LHW52908]RFU20882.1 DsbA family oxidoreductase [Geodermatophilus sp. LHW52908]